MSLPRHEKVLGARAAEELSNWRRYGNIHGEGYTFDGAYIGIQDLGAPAMNYVSVNPVTEQGTGYYNGVTVQAEFSANGQEM